MNLQFSNKELAAIINLAYTMIMADGKVDEREKVMLGLELARFGVKEEQWEGLATDAQAMDSLETISIIRNLTNDGKKYVTAFLGTLIAVDEDIDDAEMKLWKLTSALCNLPPMNIVQAVQIMKNL